MNYVQNTYAPPRFLALCLGGIIFAVYQLGWRDVVASSTSRGEPVPLPVAIACSLVVGYGLAMLVWLVRRTKGQAGETFRPTRGRILAAICLALVLPVTVFSYIPWIVGAFPILFMSVGTGQLLFALLVLIVPTVLVYPLTAMIVRHTYDRRLMRFGLFCLCFWTAYCAHLLVFGELVIRI